MTGTNTNPPVLIPMPQGLGVNGVVSWALRLAGSLAGRDWPVGLMLHTEPQGYVRAGHDLPRGVRVFDLGHIPPMSGPGQPLAPYTRAYRNALADLGWSPATPAIVLPNLDAGTYAVASALSATHGEYLRVVGWQHSDIAFDASLLAAYEPMLSAMVGVSSHIAGDLRARVPWRAGDIGHLPYGVEVEPALADREPGPIRLLYAGRLEHEQKRIGVLLDLAALLHERGVPHELRFVGDGPAVREVEDRAKGLPNARLLPPASRDRMREHLRWADALLLASRYEGLSIAMLEALAAGVVPIVTRVRSGASEALDEGVSGQLIDGEGDDRHVASRFADVIENLCRKPDQLAKMRRAAHARAAERYSMEAHADACIHLFRSVVAKESRWWPLDRPSAFGSGPSSTGSVPTDAAERAAKAIAREPGPIAVYGAGRHTLGIAHVLAHAHVVCVIDDDPKNHGKTLWGWPIVGIDQAPRDAVVLVSSFLHQEPMAKRCVEAELRALTLHDL